MAEDRFKIKQGQYKVDYDKPSKPIQLRDASGPPIHELSDKRNYEMLEYLHKLRQADPLVAEQFDVDEVYTVMNPDLAKDLKDKHLKEKTGYAPATIHRGDIGGYEKPGLERLSEKYRGKKDDAYQILWKEMQDYGQHLGTPTSDDPKDWKRFNKLTDKEKKGTITDEEIQELSLLRIAPMAKDVIMDKGAIELTPKGLEIKNWNTKEGVGALIHEFRHKGMWRNDEARNIFNKEFNFDKGSRLKKGTSSEIINRIADLNSGVPSLIEGAEWYLGEIQRQLKISDKEFAVIVAHGNKVLDKMYAQFEKD